MSLRRLPGVRRGLLEGASLWAEDDHVLAVISQRFSETYRRFYYRDIQAIVVTRCARYVLSTRSVILAVVLLVGCLFPATRVASVVLLAGCAIAWWIVSAYQSCLCRLHTAVSAETLPSVYRIWTARKFLAELEPLVQAAQADLPVPAPGQALSAGQTDAVPRMNLRVEPRGLSERRTAASLLLMFLILADAAATAYDLSLPAPRLDWIMTVLVVAQVATVVWMIIQHQMGGLARSILFWGVGFLLFVGGMMYGQTMITAFDQARSGKQAPAMTRYAPADAGLRKVYIAGCAAFALAGAFLMFRPAVGDER